MSPEKKHLIFGEEILKIFKKGLFLNPKATQFIDSTFLYPSAEEIQTILNDPDNCEREVLIQLIFFPDETVQLQLEPFLQKHPFSTQDESLLIDHIKCNFQGLSIFLPNGRGSFSINALNNSRDPTFIKDLALEHFIFHLNCSKILPDKLIFAIDDHVPDDKTVLTKMRLRNARFDFSVKNTIWLSSFFEVAYKFNGIYDEVLKFAIEFVDNLAEKDDFYTKLMDLKKAYFKAIGKNTAFETQLQKSNMETLIMQGKRSAGIDTEMARKKIILIDRISYAVYQKTEHIDPFVTENKIDNIQSGTDMQNVIKFLGT